MIKTVSAIKTEHGVAVFTRDEWNDRQPVMLSSQPVVNGTFRMCHLTEWANALDYAIKLIENHQHVIKPTAESDNALNALSYLQGNLESLVEQGLRQHKEVTEKISTDKPDLMQDYLSAFTAAVGKGEV